MSGFLQNIASLSKWEIWGDLHGTVAMLSLILFGAALALYFTLGKFPRAADWLRSTLLVLFVDLAVLDILGLFIYVPYRAQGGPRSFLLSSETTAWLHKIIFEHKEFLAFAPPILILVAAVVAFLKRQELSTDTTAKRTILFSLISALIIVLVVAAEAVLVTKSAPLK